MVLVHLLMSADASVSHMATGSVGGRCMPILVLLEVVVIVIALQY